MFEDALRKDTSDTSDLSGVTIKFALIAEPRGDVNAVERQATDAVMKATTVVNPLDSPPAAVGLTNSAVGVATKVKSVDATTNIVAKIQTFKTTWPVLMQRMELFNKIVGGIAQVFRAQSPYSFTM